MKGSSWVSEMQVFCLNTLYFILFYIGWWAVMTQAAFSFIGTEIVAVCHDNLFDVLHGVYNFRRIDCCWGSKEPEAQPSESN